MGRLYIAIIIVLFASVGINILNAQNTVGLISFSEESYDGYTLITPINYNKTYLIDNCGNIINQWEAESEAAMVAYIHSDGSLYRTARLPSMFNAGGSGGRIDKYDWNNNLVWRYDVNSETEQQHHDIEVLPNGNVLVLSWNLKSPEEALASGRKPELIPTLGIWSEKVLELKPISLDSTEIVWEWDVWDHLVQDYDPQLPNFGSVKESPHKIDINYFENQFSMVPDWLHCNSVDYNSELDQIMISCRNFNEFWIFSHDPSHASNGDLLYRWGNPMTYEQGLETDQQLFGQHDAHWIEEGRPGTGNVMIFNNGVDRPDGLYSSVIEIELGDLENGTYPLDQGASFGPIEPLWTYPSIPSMDFFSARISGAQRQPNGNTLICSGRRGDIFEVTEEEDIVWQYISPLNAAGPVVQGNPASGNDLFRAYRYPPDHSAFQDKIINSGPVIELGASATGCTSIISNVNDERKILQVKIFPNPTSRIIQLEGLKEVSTAMIYSLDGAILKKQTVSNLSTIDLGHFSEGLYILSINSLNGQRIVNKIVNKY